MGKLSSTTEPKKSKSVGLISIFRILSTLLLYIPINFDIIENRIIAYAQQQQEQNSVAADPLYISLQIAQSKVQSATSPGAWGHGVPYLHHISSQDLLMIFGITGIGCIVAYLIVRIMLNCVKEKEQEEQKEKSKRVMYQH